MALSEGRRSGELVRGANGEDALAYARLARGESVPASRKRSEEPLILFTLLSSMSVGVTAILLLFGAFGLAFGADVSAFSQKPALFCVLLVAAAMVASVLHLAKPFRAPTSLRNLASSWLSREILVVAAFWACLCAWAAAAFLAPPVLVILLNALALAFGVGLLLAAARAYRVHAQPLWDGPECAMELFAVALGAGVTWGVVSAGVLPSGVQFALCGLAVIAARFLFELSNASRIRRLANPATPREHAALALIHELEGARKRVLTVLDVTIVVCLIMIVPTLMLGMAASATPLLPAVMATIAFHLARDRFYEMSLIMRPAIRRNFR